MTGFIDMFRNNLEYIRTYDFKFSWLTSYIGISFGFNFIVWCIIIPVALFVYFIPTYMAYKKDNKLITVFVINLFAGFTILGRFGALVIALYDTE